MASQSPQKCFYNTQGIMICVKSATTSDKGTFMSGGTPLFLMEQFVGCGEEITGTASKGACSAYKPSLDIFHELPGTRNLGKEEVRGT